METNYTGLGSNNIDILESSDLEIKKKRRKAIVAGVFGNVLEWYDWSIYGYLAPVISAQFFPTADPVASLLLTFAVFAIGFIIRPLGAMIIGPFGDRVGRKKVLSLVIILMGLATFIIGILPTYQQIGIAAPLLLLCARLIQGLSTGGEWGNGTSFIVEYAPAKRRGVTGSWQQVSTGAGLLLGSLTATLFTSILSQEALNSWGWRIPFLLGIIVAIVGFYIRRKIDETPRFQVVAEKEVISSPLKEGLKKHPKEIFIAFGFAIHWAGAFYLLLTYMPTFIAKTVKMPLNLALLLNVIVILFFISIVPLMGMLSDKIGRKPLLIISSLGFAILSYPLFILMSHGGFGMILMCQMIMAVFLAAFSGPGPAAIAELFPTKIRASALSLGYNTSTAIFGGTAPFIATYLISVTGNNNSPTFYVIACAIATLLILLGMKDSYKEPLK